MKKIFALLLAAMLLFSFAACGDSADQSKDSKDSTSSTDSTDSTDSKDSDDSKDSAVETDKYLGNWNATKLQANGVEKSAEDAGTDHALLFKEDGTVDISYTDKDGTPINWTGTWKVSSDGVLELKDSNDGKLELVLEGDALALKLETGTLLFEKGDPKPKQTTESAAADAGDLGQYHVKILDAALGTDYQGNSMITIRFEYTNNSSNNMAFLTSISALAFQDGVQLSDAYSLNSSAEYENLLKVIQPGTTVICEKRYLLNSGSDVEVEVKELVSLSDTKLVKTFPLGAE